ncbi:hypothetical protein G5C51_06255 [Streptomyces sp. A7024]|uniref:Restriction endonuclease type IV Mrr domain-containing protein n=1 Tax=Streptomyces coryli TaxID=1128680 RepID=A0A6G4TVN9_9ACTN|nr:hypothetical protein [Streptomyces coryli]NGN63506.1 hypothetical protein [Streptomyces coryli]
MAESVPVRCPVCRREHSFTPPTFPCACGAPLTLPLLHGGMPVELKHRTWQDSWVSVRCPSCSRQDEWPQPEVACGCGAVIRVPVVPPQPQAHTRGAGAAGAAQGSRHVSAPETHKPQSQPVFRPAFRPVTIRTARDAVTASAQYLKWLGYPDITPAEDRPASGVDIRGSGVVAHVDPTTTPTALRDVETLWLNGLNQSAVSVFFSLAGYARDARARADELHIPLFVMDLTGTPQPVNDPADELVRKGAGAF